MTGIIEKWQTGDRNAFETLFQQYKGLVFKNAILMTNNREEAEDVLQEVFMTVWKARHTFDAEKGKFITWLHKITVNRSISRYRKKQPDSLSLEETDLDPPSIDNRALPDVALEIKYEYEELREAINQLDDRHRLVVILRFFNDLTYSEIAEVLDIPVGTVKSRIYNALKSLRGQMSMTMPNLDVESRRNP